VRRKLGGDEMFGWVKLERSLISQEMWKEPLTLRLYLFLRINAVNEKEVKFYDLTLKPGQYIRPFSLLAEDLLYLEKGKIRKPSTSTIKRSVDQLIGFGVITTEKTQYGTLFTLVNRDEDDSFFYENSIQTETQLEKKTVETTTAYKKEKEKKEKKEKIFRGNREHEIREDRINNDVEMHSAVSHNDKKVYSAAPRENHRVYSAMPGGSSEKKLALTETEETEMDRRIFAVRTEFNRLRKNKAYLSPKELSAIEHVCELSVDVDQLLTWLNEIFVQRQKTHPHDPIRSFTYCEIGLKQKFNEHITTQKVDDSSNVQDYREQETHSFLEKLEKWKQEGMKRFERDSFAGSKPTQPIWS
jgi:hypothetical protein